MVTRLGIQGTKELEKYNSKYYTRVIWATTRHPLSYYKHIYIKGKLKP